MSDNTLVQVSSGPSYLFDPITSVGVIGYISANEDNSLYYFFYEDPITHIVSTYALPRCSAIYNSCNDNSIIFRFGEYGTHNTINAFRTLIFPIGIHFMYYTHHTCNRHHISISYWIYFLF